MDVYIQLTRDCNHDCIFCSAPKDDLYLSYEDIISRIDKFSTQGVGKTPSGDFVLTGGEPTKHPDLLKIFSYLSERNLYFRVITNGVNLKDPVFVKQMYDAGLRRIYISVHHFDPKESMEISSADYPDLIDTLKGIDNVTKYSDVDVCINTTIIRQNYKVLLDIAKQFVPKYENVRAFTFNFVDICGNIVNGKNSAESIVPKYSECEKYLYDVFRYLIKHRIVFRFERSPLCYARGFEEYSSDANRNVGAEFYYTTFTDSKQKDTNYNLYGFVKSSDCMLCSLNSICSGISGRYAEIYGLSELYPVFDDASQIEMKIKLQNNYKEKLFINKIDSLNYTDLKQTLLNGFNNLDGFSRLIKPKRKVLLKFDVGGSSVNFALLKNLIESLQSNENEVVVCDGLIDCDSNKSISSFDNSGLKEFCDKMNVSCVNLLSYGYHKITIKNPLLSSSVEVSDVVDTVDFIINVSQLRKHDMTNLHCAISNIFGLVSSKTCNDLNLLQDKKSYNSLIVDIYSYFKSKISLNILDATTLHDSKDFALNNILSNFIILSRDGLAVDTVASYIVLRDILSLPTNVLAEKKNLGFLDLERVNFFGNTLDDF
ncbi:DUF362 domain-containing protein [Candidatus Woesearchaeota archaeon]|nr:DUF362 domain-containing protein [Candidatus Woesearchaeota archaeon]